MTAAATINLDPVYQDHIHAIRCALSVSAAAMGRQVAKWQNEYQAGWRVSSRFGSDMTRNDRFIQDCMTRHLLHDSLSREQWAVLVTRFAPPLHNKGRAVADRHEFDDMAASLDCLMAMLDHPISIEFTGWCLIRWARRMPPGRGAWLEWEGRTDQSIRTLHRRCADTYKALNHCEDGAKTHANELLKSALLIC